jgi:UDPglucose 6-dehydrogenase
MIYVIGLGFVGLTTAIGLAFKGNKVVAVDNDKEKITQLKNNIIQFHEPHLKENLHKVTVNKSLKLENSINLKNCENYFFICVGTPNKINGSIDLRIINDAIKNIIKIINKKNIRKNNYIIIKSTVVPGTVEYFNNSYKSIKNLYFISNPEFLREGHAWKDFVFPDKIVIGSKNKFISKKIKNLYKKFNSKYFMLSDKASEFLKYLSNTALANMISFSNEMVMLAEKNNIKEISSIFNALHTDKRWYGNPSGMSKYIYPGVGFGGYCLPKDLSALIQYSRFKKIKTPILDSVLKTNQIIFNYQFDKVRKKLKKNSKIYLLGMSFKPFSDDLRESVSLNFAKKLHKLNFKNLIICDPLCGEELKKKFDNLKIILEPKVENNSVYILLTAWPQYVRFVEKNRNLKIFDLRYTN